MLATGARDRNDTLLDAVFSAVKLPEVGQGATVIESHESYTHTETHHESHEVHEHFEHHEHNENVIFSNSSAITVGNVISSGTTGVQHAVGNQHADDDNRSEISALSKATSVSVHSSVSQQSAQQYNLPQAPYYDVPPVIVGDVVASKRNSVASQRSSVASSKSSKVSVATHDSESTITNGTLVEKPIIVGGVVAGHEIVVGGAVGSQASTPIVAPKTPEHEAVLEQFKNLHGKAPSVVSSIVPRSVRIESDSEDSIAPSRLTESIVPGNGLPILARAQEINQIDFVAPYYPAPSIKDNLDTRSEDSFGFEHVEYVDNKSVHNDAQSVTHVHEQSRRPSEHVTQVVQEHVTHETYDPYHSVYQNHVTPTTVFDNDVESHHESLHESQYQQEHHSSEHHTFETREFSHSNFSTTEQSPPIHAHPVGPRITEELRSSVVTEEVETHVEPPVLAYVAPLPTKPPRNHEEVHSYNAYADDQHQYQHQHVEVIKETTIIHSDVRTGPGVHALRSKFENGVAPPLNPVLEVRNVHGEEHHHDQHHHEHQQQQEHHHHHHHEEHHVQVGEHVSVSQNHHYDVPFESHESHQNSSSLTYASPEEVAQNNHHHHHYHDESIVNHIYDTPAVEKHHSSEIFRGNEHHHYVPQIKVITEYRHIDPRHHYIDVRSPTRLDGGSSINSSFHSPVVNTVDYFNEFDKVHHDFLPTPTSPSKEVRHSYHQHSYVPELSVRRESRSVERSHHYIPEFPKAVKVKTEILRNHNYIPMETRTVSEESNKVVPRDHHYVPLISEKKNLESQNKKENLQHHHYYPTVPERRESRTVQRSHNFIPDVSKPVQTKEQILREHNYLPLGNRSKSEETKQTTNRGHQYVPLVIGNKTSKSEKESLTHHHYYPTVPTRSDKNVTISREHNYTPVINQTDQNPRHENDLSHHQYVPLSSKCQRVDDKQLIREHQFVPVLPKIEQKSNQLSTIHHYLPIASRKEVEKSENIGASHHYIPPLTAKKEMKTVVLEEHHYLPPRSQLEKSAAPDFQHHNYQPLVQTKTDVTPRLPNDHHYVPVVLSRNEDLRPSLEDHHYLPPISKQIKNQQEVLRSHGYVPVVNKAERNEEVGRSHGYVPVVHNIQTDRIEKEQHHNYIPPVAPRLSKIEKVNEHVQLGGSRRSTAQSEYHHRASVDHPSRPSSVASLVRRQPHSRTSSVSTVRSSAPVQRVSPTVQHLYGDHQSVRVVKNVRQYINEHGPQLTTPPQTPFAGFPRLSNSPRSPISPLVFEPVVQKPSSRKSTVISNASAPQKIHNGSRKSSVSSVRSSSTLVGGNVVPRSRQSTITNENVNGHHHHHHHHHAHQHEEDDVEIVHVSEMRKLFEQFGPTHLPEYAATPQAYIH